MKETVLTIIPAVAIAIGLIVIATIVIYTFTNGSGHTGASPYQALAVFIPVVITGAVCVFIRMKVRGSLACSLFAVLIGCVGIAMLIYLDRSNTLLQYDVWLLRGMP